jgi:hypothetical protein
MYFYTTSKRESLEGKETYELIIKNGGSGFINNFPDRLKEYQMLLE